MEEEKCTSIEYCRMGGIDFGNEYVDVWNMILISAQLEYSKEYRNITNLEMLWRERWSLTLRL